jgi:hypothetical protein
VSKSYRRVGRTISRLTQTQSSHKPSSLPLFECDPFWLVPPLPCSSSGSSTLWLVPLWLVLLCLVPLLLVPFWLVPLSLVLLWLALLWLGLLSLALLWLVLL